MFNYFYNDKLSYEANSILFWTWESIIHHLYFIVLFLQRQTSENWQKENLWRVNMEKECEFFELLFGGDARFCADAIISLFAGLWFRTSKPTPGQLQWIGRLIANYQHSEAIIHFAIVLSGFVIVYILGNVKKKTGSLSCGVPAWVRWFFFISLFIEVYTMCFPYFFLFSWAWLPFVQAEKDPLVAHLESLSDIGGFHLGIQFGGALISMFYVAVLVTILDVYAMLKAWNFAVNGTDRFFSNALLNGVSIALTIQCWSEFFSDTGRATGGDGFSTSEFISDRLQALFGNDPVRQKDLI